MSSTPEDATIKLTGTDLRNLFAVVYNMIEKERAMRGRVFQHEPRKLGPKIEECNKALTALIEMKDFAKQFTHSQLDLFGDGED